MYNKGTKKLSFVALDYSTYSVVGGKNINPTKLSLEIGSQLHECETQQKEIHVPFLFFQNSGLSYLAFVTTGSGNPCSNVEGFYYIYTVDPESSTISLTNALSTYQGVKAYYEINEAPVQAYADISALGLTTISKYANTVDMMILEVSGTKFLINLVFYEQT